MTRTSGTQFRKLLLYPPELQGQNYFMKIQKLFYIISDITFMSGNFAKGIIKINTNRIKSQHRLDLISKLTLKGYSTVTLLARFLGWSTLHFLAVAI